MKLIRTVWKQSKWMLLAVLALLAAGLLLIQKGNSRTDLLLSGLGINAALTEEGTAWMTEELSRALYAGNREETAYVVTTMTPFSNEGTMNDNYYLLQYIVSLCRSDSLDYFILDKTAMENLISQDLFLDLGQFFTAEERRNMEPELVYSVAAPEKGEEIDLSAKRPVALEVSGLPFFKENGPDGALYFAISSRSTRVSACRVLWEHILAWKNQAS